MTNQDNNPQAAATNTCCGTCDCIACTCGCPPEGCRCEAAACGCGCQDNA